MQTSHQEQALVAGTNMVDSLISLRASITNLNSSSALINSKPPYEWTSAEWYTFFFAPITVQEALIQVADSSAPVVGQYNTQLLSACSAIAHTYHEIHNQPEGSSLSSQRRLELARSIVEPLVLAGITPVALLAATVTRAGATYYPPENIVALASPSRVSGWLNNTNLRAVGAALNPNTLFARARNYFSADRSAAIVDDVTGQPIPHGGHPGSDYLQNHGL